MKIKNKNHIKVFKSSKALMLLLSKAKLDCEDIIIWRFAGGKKLKAFAKIKVIRKYRDELVLCPPNSQIEKFEDVISGTDIVNVFLPHDGVLFQTTIKSYEDNDLLTLAKPTQYAQIDRRKHFRLNVVDHSNLKVIIPSKKSLFAKELHKNIYDLSVGGFSVLCNKSELRELYVEAKIKGIKFYLGKEVHMANISVVSHYELDPMHNSDIIYKCWKISFEFKKYKSEFLESLNNYVFEHLDKEDLKTY
jgi:c-di-GMP-binding flagellar brake protein YcgR